MGGDPERPEDGPGPVRSGDDAPPVPEDAPSLLRRVAPDASGSSFLAVRVGLAEHDERYARGILSELHNELDVLGSTLEADGLDDEASFTVVVSRDYAPAAVVEALAGPPEVEGVTAVGVDPGEASPADEGDGGVPEDPGPRAADQDEVSAAIDAVETGPADDDAGDDDGGGVGPVGGEPGGAGEATDADGEGPTPETGGAATADDGGVEGSNAERATTEDAAPGPTDDERPSAAGDPESAGGESGTTASGPPGDAGTAASAAPDGATGQGGGTANHPAFEELREDVEPVSYDSLVDELESTSLPGEFEDRADLDPVIEGDTSGEDGTADYGDGSTADAEVTEGDVDVPDLEENGHGDGAPAVDPDAVIQALVTALEEDALTDDQRRTLSEAVGAGQPKTLQVKLDHLQREVDELSAYKETLEGFIEEYGSGDGLVEQVREAMQTFSSDVERIGEEVETLQDHLERNDERLGDLDGTVAETADEVADLQARVEKTEDDLGEVADRVAETEQTVGESEERLRDLAERVESIDGQVEDNAARLESLDGLASQVDALEEMDERLDALSEDLEALRSDVADGTASDEDVQQRLTDVEETLGELDVRVSALEQDTSERVDSLADRLDAVEQRLDEQEAWREQFRSLLGDATTPDEPGREE